MKAATKETIDLIRNRINRSSLFVRIKLRNGITEYYPKVGKFVRNKTSENQTENDLQEKNHLLHLPYLQDKTSSTTVTCLLE